MPDRPPSPGYLHAQRQHLADSEQDIQALEAILAERPWSRLERHAAERTLQLLIEGCIGLAKQWVRRETGQACAEALTAFQRLADAGLIEAATPWRRIIGLRNVLVHDYLEVDERVVRDVIEARHYRALLDFGAAALKALSRD